MKKNLLLNSILGIAIALGVSSCMQNSSNTSETANVRHYRNLLFTESPWDSIKGAREISPKEAETINNYKFTYDDSGRLLQVEYCRGDSLLGYSGLGVAKVTFTYEGNKEIRHYFNSENEPVTTSGKVFSAVYELDNTGFRTGLKFYDKDGNPVENGNKIGYYTWSKTILGMVKENRYRLTGEETVMSEFCPFYELRFSYNDKGYVTRMANYDKDSLYNCTAENCGNIGVSYFQFDRNDKGDVLQFSVHSTTGQLSNLYWGWAKNIQKFDDNGYMIERVQYDQDNELLGGKMVPVTQYTYDEHGAVIEEKYLDANGRPMDNNAGIAVRKYEYNDYGRRTATISYDANMQKVES